MGGQLAQIDRIMAHRVAEENLRAQLVDARVEMVAAHEAWEGSQGDPDENVHWEAFQEACDVWSAVSARHRSARRRLEKIELDGL